MSEKESEILELTELLEEDFEKMEGVEDFAPEEAFDVEELDSELDQMLNENGQQSGLKDEDIDLSALFDEEEETDAVEQEKDEQPVQETPDVQETEDIDPEQDLSVEDEGENLSDSAEKQEEPVAEKTKSDPPQDDAVEPLPEKEQPEAPATVISGTILPSASKTAPPEAENESVTDLQQKIAELQDTVAGLQAQLDELNSGLSEKIQAEVDAKTPQKDDADQNQALQEQYAGLEARLQQLEAQQTDSQDQDAITSIQQEQEKLQSRLAALEAQQAENKQQDAVADVQQKQEEFQNRLAALESQAGEKIDVEAMQTQLQDFITQKIPATVAGMLREEIAALARQLGN